jgi:hypothetical protein
MHKGEGGLRLNRQKLLDSDPAELITASMFPDRILKKTDTEN